MRRPNRVNLKSECRRPASELPQNARRRQARDQPLHVVDGLQRIANRTVGRAVIVVAGRVHHLDEERQPAADERERAAQPEIEPAVAYAIARQESTFNPKTVSSARAMGLMQVTPEAARYVAKKFGVAFDEKRLLGDQSYNVQLGAAELGDLYADYRGSHILTFVGYNAGRGRIRDWIAKYGDPRDPKVDPIDWVERIPFSETRNYVQRVLENLQVYRARFSGSSKLQIDAELMSELREVRDVVQPHDVLLVVDAMTGQEAVNVATEFDEGLAFVHPEDWDTVEEFTLCSDCHTGGKDLYE